jgi:branched-chain amino acid transport system ATP-binding protein
VPALLEVDGLSVRYGGLTALDDVSIVVPEGTVVALLGANGAGKSTLLKAVAGLVGPSAGEVRLRGDALDGSSAHDRARRGLCLIPEGRGIFPALTVADNLRVALDDDDGGVERVTSYFPVLAQRLDQLAGTLSGGEQQMLALARAIGSEPLVLMADELSLGLAPLLVKEMASTLRRLHEEQGRTILLVEQYVAHAVRLADFVYILHRGRLAWAGEPDELRASAVLVESYLGAEV